jgi:hypothetical protein
MPELRLDMAEAGALRMQHSLQPALGCCVEAIGGSFMTQQPSQLPPTIAGKIALARVLGDANRSLALLRIARGTTRRTQLRIARTAAMVLASAALLTAEPAAANVPSFVLESNDSFVGSSASPAAFRGALGPHAIIGDANGDLVERSTTSPFGLANVGTFAAPTFADIDGDGDPDALVGNGAGNIVVFLNTGSGVPAFAAASTNPFGLGQVDGRSHPAFVDIDGDGDLDALVGNIPGDTVFFRNDGTAASPAFVQVESNPFGLQNVGQVSAPAFGDVDQDGDADAFIGNADGDTFFFKNTGSATVPLFAAPIKNAFGLTQVSGEASPFVADIDEDDDIDVAIGAVDGKVAVFVDQFSCPAMFSGSTVNPFGLPQVDSFADPAFVDIDGDGDFDAFIGMNGSDRFVFSENLGRPEQPEFGPTVVNPFGLPVGNLFEVSPAFADIDGDGDLDAFIGEQYGHTLQFTNTGSATAPAFAEFPISDPFGQAGEPFSKPTFGDIDDDGDLDVFVGGRNGGFFFENTGSATMPAFAAPVSNPFGLSDIGDANNPTLIDLDVDGDLDLVAGEAFGDLFVFGNVGTKSAPQFIGTTNGFGLANVGASSAPSFADIDGDGDPDALVGTAAGTIVFFDNGARSQPATPAPTATATAPPTVVIVTVLPTDTRTQTPTPTPSVTGSLPPSATATATATASVTGSRPPDNTPSATATATASVTGSRPPDATPSATPNVTPGACVGDCNGNGTILVNEIVFGVNIVLGAGDLRDCASLDTDGDGEVKINNLIEAVGNLLNGCN